MRSILQSYAERATARVEYPTLEELRGLRFTWNVPNALVLLRFALAPSICFLAATDVRAFAVVAVVAWITDLADGFFARALNQTTNWGRVADWGADFAVLLAAGIGLAVGGHLPGWLVALVMGRYLVFLAGNACLLRQSVNHLPGGHLTGPVTLAAVAAVFVSGTAKATLITVAASLSGLSVIIYLVGFARARKAGEERD